MNTRAGHYKSNLSGEMAYKSFVPNPLPPAPPIELSEDIISLLVKANSRRVQIFSELDWRSRQHSQKCPIYSSVSR